VEFPVYIRIGDYALHPHFVFEALAYVVGFQIFLRMRRREGDPVDWDGRLWVFTAAAVGAAMGSKLLYWLEDPLTTWARWDDVAYMLGGKTIIGGLAGGLIAVEWTKKQIGVRRSTGDLFAIPLAMGIAIGRIGCFLTGLPDHTYGNPTSLPWGVDFGDGIPRHPTQPYEIGFLLLLTYILWRKSSNAHASGDVFRLFMVGYMGWRLVIEFWKPGIPLAGLTALQWACLRVLIYYRQYLRRSLDALSTATAS
jgi:phosphatidylglycerol---prolipoprotein diacylglyceryl transferase